MLRHENSGRVGGLKSIKSKYAELIPRSMCQGPFQWQRKVCSRSAQGFDSSARQMPENGEQMILANQGQNRAQASRNLIRKLGLPEPPRRRIKT
eukprot:symbB.v1.2.008731.t1/scaffold542.1/size189608/4